MSFSPNTTQPSPPSSTPTVTDRPPPESDTYKHRLKFPKDQAGFLAELRRRVDAYFAETGNSPRDSWRMYLKTSIILSWLAASYIFLVFVVSNWWLAIPLAVSLAVAIAAVGFNIQHDAGHSAYSRFGWVNRLGAMSLDLIGASSYLWHWKHVVFHHTYPNVDGEDPDIDPGVVARLSPHRPLRWFHRWQHLYLWPLYGLTASRWHLWGDFKDVITGTIGPHKIPRPKGWDLFVFILGKVTSVSLMLALPMFFHPWWLVLAFYMFVTIVVGIVLTVVFQLAHCVAEAEFPLPIDGTQRMEEAWAIHQIQTTVNFARGSWILCWLLGGLNFQIEHHLFPRVCHVHYPALSRIVESTCQEFGVSYANHGSFLDGLGSHYRWLRTLGQPEPAV